MSCFCKIGVVLLLLLVVCLMPLSAVEKKSNSKNDSVKVAFKDKSKFMFSPFAAPVYTPELKLMVTLGALMSFDTDKLNPDNERSSIPFSIGYSTNGSIDMSAFPIIYTRGERFRFITKIHYKNMPYNYWGVGIDAGNRVSKADETTSYDREWFSAKGKISRKLIPDLYIGLAYDINSTRAKSLNDFMKEEVYVKEFGTAGTNIGLGAVIDLDKRDNVQMPFNGYLLSFSFIKYNDWFDSSDNQYNKYTFDARKYFQIKERKTLALQLEAMYAENNVPWFDLPQLGTPYDLRGYQWGRFRDKLAMFGLLEYRHMFMRNKLNKKGNYESPFGFVCWAGGGTVASEFSTIAELLPNVGLGFRIEVQPRLCVRLDYGFAKDNSGLYISFREAF